MEVCSGWPETFGSVGIMLMALGGVLFVVGALMVFGGFFARFGF
jgi:hypothetical protein